MNTCANLEIEKHRNFSYVVEQANQRNANIRLEWIIFFLCFFFKNGGMENFPIVFLWCIPMKRMVV
jgi:hypothetical protein